MRASDIAKLAAAIAAGSITYSAVISELDDDGDISILDSILAGGAGSIAGGLAGKVMDVTGVTDLIDEVFDW